MRVGLLTGSGMYDVPGIELREPATVATAFGDVELTRGTLGAAEIVHVSRHGAGHVRVSHQVEHRATISALRDAQVDAILAVTVCGAVDPSLTLGELVVFDDLWFQSNRLPDGSLCTFNTDPGAPGRGHWVFELPFHPHLRAALLGAARELGHAVRDGGCYGHVDGPRFNTAAEIRLLAAAGVSAVSQTAGPETVLAGEAGIPYAVVGFVTDYANGVTDEATPVSELVRLIGVSAARFAGTLAGALERIDPAALGPVGSSITWD